MRIVLGDPVLGAIPSQALSFEGATSRFWTVWQHYFRQLSRYNVPLGPLSCAWLECGGEGLSLFSYRPCSICS